MSWKDKFKNGAIPNEYDYSILIELAEAKAAITKTDINQYSGGGGGVLYLQPSQTPATLPISTYGKSFIATASAGSAKDLLNIVFPPPPVLPITKVASNSSVVAMPFDPEAVPLNINSGAEIIKIPSFTPSGSKNRLIVTAKISIANAFGDGQTSATPQLTLFHNSTAIDSVNISLLGGKTETVILQAALTIGTIGAISVRGAGRTYYCNQQGPAVLILQEAGS